MQLADDGVKMVATSSPWWAGKIFAVIFVVLAVAFPALMLFSLIRTPATSTIDCSRERGNCELSWGESKRTVELGDLETAQLIHARSTRNTSSSDRVQVQLWSGEKLWLSEPGYSSKITSGYRAAVGGLVAFLHDPSAPAFKTTYVASDTDWSVGIVFTIVCPLMAWFFVRAWVTRRVEIDRPAGLIRVHAKRVLREETEVGVPFADVTGVQIMGGNIVYLRLLTDELNLLLVSAGKGASDQQMVRKFVGLLAEIAKKPAWGTQASFFFPPQG